jgi:hypothetical protein
LQLLQQVRIESEQRGPQLLHDDFVGRLSTPVSECGQSIRAT